jgi:hypothetical protein
MKYAVAIEVARPPHEVFNHLLHDVPGFWPEDYEGSSARLDDEFVFSSGHAHYSKNKVVELVPDKKVVWLVTESIRKTDGFEWTGTKMTFELTGRSGHTLLEYTYDGPVLETESERLKQVCDMVIKDNLYHRLTGSGKSFTATIEVAASPL